MRPLDCQIVLQIEDFGFLNPSVGTKLRNPALIKKSCVIIKALYMDPTILGSLSQGFLSRFLHST